jgi:hypothetical protein
VHGAATAQRVEFGAVAKRPTHDLDLGITGRWRREDGTFARWLLRVGGKQHEILADEATGRALATLLEALPATLDRLERERNALADEVEALTGERDALKKGQGRGTAPAAAPSKSAGKPSALDEVPLDMIGTFTVSAQMKSAAKKDPLLALAVQVAKANDPDASPLEQARLRAMAAAVSRGDLDTFWAASAERSRKKLGG